jgi:hypothetical protein
MQSFLLNRFDLIVFDRIISLRWGEANESSKAILTFNPTFKVRKINSGSLYAFKKCDVDFSST